MVAIKERMRKERLLMVCYVELLCVGNELLIGKVLNSNAQWIGDRVTRLAGVVRRITAVGDDVEEISSAVKEALTRKPNFVITTGGLGPTFDDKTLQGIAIAVNRPLKVNDQALKMVEEKYRLAYESGRLKKVEITQYRLKMATLPDGAIPLNNPIGTAPGVLFQGDGTAIVSLPGVPAEMKAIFEESVVPLIRKASGGLTFYEKSLIVTRIIESDLAPIIDEVMRDNSYVYIKSHPSGAERTMLSTIELHVSTTAENVDLARERVEKAINQMSALIVSQGGKIA
jgi:molybdenum cofactor synthesis domain-containing protein